MTLAATGTLFWPMRAVTPRSINITLGRTAITFDSATDRIAYVGRSRLAETLSKVHIQTITVTTGCTILVQIESVTAGRPSGTIIAAGASTTVAIADTDDNAWKTATIGTPPSLTVGQEFAVVVTVSSGTPNLQFAAGGAAYESMANSHPGYIQDTGAGSWTAQPDTLIMILEHGTSGVTEYASLSPLNASGTITSFNSSSTPDEYAMKLVAPMKCRVVGVAAVVYNVAAGADFMLSLWPSSSSVDGDALGQALTDGDVAPSTANDAWYQVYFTTPATLTAGSTYYIGLRAETANNISRGVLESASGITNSHRAFPIGSTTAFVMSSRTWTAGTAGAWTDAANSIMHMCLIIDQLDDGASAGGLLRNPGMNGGKI